MIPIEFQHLPSLRPPAANGNGLWLVLEEWRTPPLDGKQVVIRAAQPMPDGTWAGFWTDGASVPLIFWTASGIDPFGLPFFASALGHDAAYAAELAPRGQCDDWMLSWAKLAGTNWYRRNVAYGAVRTAGGGVWGEHTQHSIEQARKVVQLVKQGEPAIWEKL